VEVTPSEIFVTPTIGPGGVFGLNFASPGFSLAGADFATYDLIFTWDPSDIRSLEDVLFFDSPVAPGFVEIETTGCL
jgi:hypothetical protein